MPMLSWGVGIRVWEESRPMDSQGRGGGGLAMVCRAPQQPLEVVVPV